MTSSTPLERLLSGDPQEIRLQPQVQIVLPRFDMLVLDSVHLIDLFHPFVKDSFFQLSYATRPKSVQAPLSSRVASTRLAFHQLTRYILSLRSPSDGGISVRPHLALRPLINQPPLLDHQWSTGAWPLPFRFDVFEVELPGRASASDFHQVCTFSLVSVAPVCVLPRLTHLLLR